MVHFFAVKVPGSYDAVKTASVAGMAEFDFQIVAVDGFFIFCGPEYH